MNSIIITKYWCSCSSLPAADEISSDVPLNAVMMTQCSNTLTVKFYKEKAQRGLSPFFFFIIISQNPTRQGSSNHKSQILTRCVNVIWPPAVPFDSCCACCTTMKEALVGRQMRARAHPNALWSTSYCLFTFVSGRKPRSFYLPPAMEINVIRISFFFALLLLLCT